MNHWKTNGKSIRQSPSHPIATSPADRFRHGAPSTRDALAAPSAGSGPTWEATWAPPEDHVEFRWLWMVNPWENSFRKWQNWCGIYIILYLWDNLTHITENNYFLGSWFSEQKQEFHGHVIVDFVITIVGGHMGMGQNQPCLPGKKGSTPRLSGFTRKKSRWSHIYGKITNTRYVIIYIHTYILWNGVDFSPYVVGIFFVGGRWPLVLGYQ